jgi:predicted DNA-binding ArsR family transcriptional regulator
LPEKLRNGVSRSSCSFCRIIFGKEGELSLKLYVCKIKMLNTSEWIVPEFDNEDKDRYFMLYTVTLFNLVVPKCSVW